MRAPVSADAGIAAHGYGDLEGAIASIASQWLGTNGESIDPTMPFALMGLDSLSTIELGAALESALGVELGPDAVAEYSNIRSLAALVRQQRDKAKAATDPLEAMLADCVLPEDVRPAARARSAAGSLLKAKGILVTGATGFLGSRLVAELLDRSNARLFCLVRGGSAPPRRRLLESLAAFGVTPAAFDARVETIAGDLSHRRLGLAEPAVDALSHRIDAIVHAAASVNWVFAYESLRSTNVLGTLELLRFACRRSIPFHFVSSISVCYASCGPHRADEQFNPLDHLHGVHVGYAQTKIVSETLVREAGRRGLAVRIYRPTLVSGDSRTGAFNADDLLSLMIKACIHMGAAPDLDWALDCLPVDVVSSDIVALSAVPESRLPNGGVFHLVHAKPRHWRECVLWMRLYGYSIRLKSYRDWLRQLEIGTDPSKRAATSHPLRALRSFFLDRNHQSLTIPELYEECRRTKAIATETARLLARRRTVRPALDACLLDRYFAAFTSGGHLPVPGRATRKGVPREHMAFDADFFTRAMCSHTETVERAELTSSGSEHSIIAELSAWQWQRQSGLLRYRLHLRNAGRSTTRNVVVKIKPPDETVMTVGEALANLCDRRVGNAYTRWRDRTGLLGSHLREKALYEMRDAGFQRHRPALLGSRVDQHTGECVLIIDEISNAILMDSVEQTPVWPREHLDVAVRGLAALQSVWYGRAEALVQSPWIGFVQSARSAEEMIELWAALAAHAAPFFSTWADRDLPRIQTTLIDSIRRWWTILEDSPRTLIHHDFNPRNFCLRIRRGRAQLCAYDWELATIGAPQRDLAELLCFVLPATATDEDIEFWIERHRLHLERETSSAIDLVEWRRAFAAALYDVLVNRLAMYALVHRVKPQAFLPRVVRTWRRLYQRFPADRE